MLRRLVAGVCLGAAAIAASTSAYAQVTVTLSCSALGIEMELCRAGAERWAEATGNEVKLVSTPADANERLSLYQTLLAAGSADIDIFQIDVVWPGILAAHFIDLAPYLPHDERHRHLDVLVESNTVDGRLVAAPWFVDAGLLYYRADLLEDHGFEVPETWHELTATAETIVESERAAGNARMQGFVFQGRAYEGLTTNALEWIASFGGGTIVDADGRVTIDNPRAAEALGLARSWVGTIAPAGVLNYAEEEARGVFQSGNAVFMRNWPYAWALANAEDSPVRGQVGIAPLPRGAGEGAGHAATLGGQQLAVSRFSAHPEEAADLVAFLTGAEEQKRRAIEGAFNPTRPALYEDTELLEANPFLAGFADVLDGAVVRPSSVAGERYARVSNAVYNAVHATLAGSGSAEDNLAGLAHSLERISRGGRW